MKNVLIDTDVILDFFFDRQPFSENAAQVLSLAEKNEIQGFITPVIVSNVYYLLRQTATHSKVIEKLKVLMTILDVIDVSKATILNAMNSEFKDFEDALQNFAAVDAGKIEVILTRNVKDFKNSTLSIQTPESFIKVFHLNL